MEKVLITGASGMIGKSLVHRLVNDGFAVRVLSRSAKKIAGADVVTWNPEKGELDSRVFEGVHHIIHLAGENIGGRRWTTAQKNVILKSRVDSANLIFERSAGYPIQTFISASGVSIYGQDYRKQTAIESDEAERDFLAQVTVAWEKAADQFSTRNIRVLKLRTGVVLNGAEGALPKMVKPIRLGFGAVLGSGKQFIPWIHLQDLVSIYACMLKHTELSGAYNVVAPQHCTNRELTLTAAKILGKKIWLPPVPGFVLKLMLGEMADLVLTGRSVSADKLLGCGYQFQFPKLDEALLDCLDS